MYNPDCILVAELLSVWSRRLLPAQHAQTGMERSDWTAGVMWSERCVVIGWFASGWHPGPQLRMWYLGLLSVPLLYTRVCTLILKFKPNLEAPCSTYPLFIYFQ